MKSRKWFLSKQKRNLVKKFTKIHKIHPHNGAHDKPIDVIIIESNMRHTQQKKRKEISDFFLLFMQIVQQHIQPFIKVYSELIFLNHLFV